MTRDSILNSFEAILNNGVGVISGSEARRAATKSTRELGAVVATTMGPFGLDKLVVNNGGNVYVTNDSVTILRNLHLTDPVGRTVLEVANSQIFNAGDGTTTALLLTSELLRRALELCERGVHPTSVVDGYQLAAEAAQRRLLEIAERYDLTDRSIALDVARTSLSGSSAGYEREHLAELVVSAVEQATNGYDVDLNAIRFRRSGGRDMAASKLVNGAILEAVPKRKQMRASSESIKLLAFDGEITLPQTNRSFVADAGTMTAGTFEAADRRWVNATSDRLLKSGVNLLVCSGTIDEAVANRLRRAGIDYLTNVSRADMRFLRRVIEGDLLRAIEEIEPNRTVPIALEYDWEAGRTMLTTDDPSAITVLLFSQSEAHRDQLKSKMSDAVEVVAQVAYDGRVLPGGGAPELEMARAIDTMVGDRDSRSQLAVDAFGESLLSIPQTLLRNAGLDPIDRLHAQQAAHHDGDWFAAVDLETGAVIDAREQGILETLIVKQHAISVSLDAACMLIKIDGILESSQD